MNLVDTLPITRSGFDSRPVVRLVKVSASQGGWGAEAEGDIPVHAWGYPKRSGGHREDRGQDASGDRPHDQRRGTTTALDPNRLNDRDMVITTVSIDRGLSGTARPGDPVMGSTCRRSAQRVNVA